MWSKVMKPEYVYQPRMALRRIVRNGHPEATHVLPWGHVIGIPQHDMHAVLLHRMGVIDLAVTETLYRLATPGASVIDVGANYGYMTSVLALRVAPEGRVLAVEANPQTFAHLSANVRRWPETGVVHAANVAASCENGMVTLNFPPGSDRNSGLVSVRLSTDDKGAQITARRLDDLAGEWLSSADDVELMKIDVEGHELAVLEGSRELLARRRVRNIVFEENGSVPSPVTQFLRNEGFTLFRLHKSFRGVDLLPLDDIRERSSWEPCNFLATLTPAEAKEVLRPRGWRCLK